MQTAVDRVIEEMPLQWLPVPNSQSALMDVAQLYEYDTPLFDTEWASLVHPYWRYSYLDYHHIKEGMKINTKEDICMKLENEWNKVYAFYSVKLDEITKRINNVSRDMESIFHHQKNILADIYHLHHYIKLNYSGFMRLFIHFDRLFQARPTDALRQTITNKPFWEYSSALFDPLCDMNNIYSHSIRHNHQLSHHSSPHLISSVNHMKEPLSITTKGDTTTETPSLSSSLSTTSSCETASADLNCSILKLPPSTIKTKKYLVHPDHITEIMLFLSDKMILQNKENNPSYTYPALDEVGTPTVSPYQGSFHRAPSTSNHNTHTKMTTIYMDTSSFDHYAERVTGQILNDNIRTDSTMSRIRWHTSIADDTTSNIGDTKYVSLEQKVYHLHSPNPTNRRKGHKSMGKSPQMNRKISFKKEPVCISWINHRLWLKSRRLYPWLKGKYSCLDTVSKATCQYRVNDHCTNVGEDKQRMSLNAYLLEKAVHSFKKIPVLKTTQKRIVYVSPDSRLSVSIDTEMTMMRYSSNEQQGDTLPGDNRDHYPYSKWKSKDISRFPYCVVQVSEACHISENTAIHSSEKWLSQLCSSPLMESVDNFSSYLHGVAQVYSKTVHVFPDWMATMDTMDIRHPFERGTLLFNKNPSTHTRDYNSNEKIFDSNSLTDYSTNSCERNTPRSGSMGSLTLHKKMMAHSSPSPVVVNEATSLLNSSSTSSYCSFNHPSSSKSDPTHCSICINQQVYQPTIGHSSSHLTQLVSILYSSPERSRRDIESRNTVHVVSHRLLRAAILTASSLLFVFTISYIIYMSIIIE
ncbi:VTC domain-containing protein [Pilobolus umbonatus]|nr:VTC domain-containing protein [Pilobolus umbonatus]